MLYMGTNRNERYQHREFNQPVDGRSVDCTAHQCPHLFW